MSLRALSESLARVLDESREKKSRKTRMYRRANEQDKVLARQIGAAIKARKGEIMRMIPDPWDIGDPLLLDKQAIERRGQAYLTGRLVADFEEPIGVVDDIEEPDPEIGFRGREFQSGIFHALADFSIGCSVFNDGNVRCEAAIGGFDPRPGEDGVEMTKPLRDNEIVVAIEWKRKKKPFDPAKNLWPLLKSVMVALRKGLPEYKTLGERR